MKKTILTATSVLALSACSSIVNHQTQDVTMRTPGAENARCLIENPDFKYQIFTDETLEIMKSPNDLVIRCLAPGNRERTVHVKRGINDWVFANVANGFVPGAAYDYFSRGAFEYPEELVVSFEGMPAREYPLPQYEQERLRGINAGAHNNLERMADKTWKASEGDDYGTAQPLQKKANPYGNDWATQPAPYRPAPVKPAYDPREEDK